MTKKGFFFSTFPSPAVWGALKRGKLFPALRGGVATGRRKGTVMMWLQGVGVRDLKQRALLTPTVPGGSEVTGSTEMAKPGVSRAGGGPSRPTASQREL